MKKIIIGLLALLLSVSVTACTPNKTDEQRVIDQINIFFKAMEKGDFEGMLNATTEQRSIEELITSNLESEMQDGFNLEIFGLAKDSIKEFANFVGFIAGELIEGYEVTEVIFDEEGKTAEAKVLIKLKDLESVGQLEDFITEEELQKLIMENLSLMISGDKKDKDKAIENFLDFLKKKFSEAIANAEIVEETASVHLEKVDNKWKINLDMEESMSLFLEEDSETKEVRSVIEEEIELILDGKHELLEVWGLLEVTEVKDSFSSLLNTIIIDDLNIKDIEIAKEVKIKVDDASNQIINAVLMDLKVISIEVEGDEAIATVLADLNSPAVELDEFEEKIKNMMEKEIENAFLLETTAEKLGVVDRFLAAILNDIIVSMHDGEIASEAAQIRLIKSNNKWKIDYSQQEMQLGEDDEE